MSTEELLRDATNKLQYMVDNWPTKLEDRKFTFPDGDWIEQTPKKKIPKSDSKARTPLNDLCEKCGRRYCDHEEKY